MGIGVLYILDVFILVSPPYEFALGLKLIGTSPLGVSYW